MEWQPINHRIIKARFFFRYSKLSIIQCYVPTGDAEDEEKDEFYALLQRVLESLPNMMVSYW